MSTTRKRRNNTGTTTTDNDRLSSLPDSLRLHILSLVPTKYAARTSLLSRKWRDLFLDAPRIALEYSPPLRSRPARNFIDFDFDLDGNYSDSDSLGRKHADDAEFLRFVNRRLMLGSLPAPPIDEFRLICPTLSKGSSIDVWLANLLRRGIKVVEIEQVDPKSCLGIGSQNPPRNPLPPQPLVNPLFPPMFPPISRNPKGYSLHPPAGFFQSKTLVVLRFCGGTLTFDSSESVFFPNLKVLSLESLTIYVKSKTMRFNKLGYPLLEDLELRKLYSGDEIAIEISSQTLKKAAIVSTSLRSFTRINIDAPHLQHLECEDFGRGVSLKECETLESAVLCMCSPAGFNPRAFIETLRNLKRLDVDLKQFPDRVLVDDSLPEFPNLTHLGFQHDSSAGAKEFLWDLLHQAPNLEKLAFDMDELIWQQMSTRAFVPRCFSRKLREISLHKFSGTESQVALVEWLLNLQGALLEKIVVEGKSKEWPSSTVNRFLKIAQLHPKCEIVL